MRGAAGGASVLPISSAAPPCATSMTLAAFIAKIVVVSKDNNRTPLAIMSEPRKM